MKFLREDDDLTLTSLDLPNQPWEAYPRAPILTVPRGYIEHRARALASHPYSRYGYDLALAIVLSRYGFLSYMQLVETVGSEIGPGQPYEREWGGAKYHVVAHFEENGRASDMPRIVSNHASREEAVSHLETMVGKLNGIWAAHFGGGAIWEREPHRVLSDATHALRYHDSWRAVRHGSYGGTIDYLSVMSDDTMDYLLLAKEISRAAVTGNEDFALDFDLVRLGGVTVPIPLHEVAAGRPSEETRTMARLLLARDPVEVDVSRLMAEMGHTPASEGLTRARQITAEKWLTTIGPDVPYPRFFDPEAMAQGAGGGKDGTYDPLAAAMRERRASLLKSGRISRVAQGRGSKARGASQRRDSSPRTRYAAPNPAGGELIRVDFRAKRRA